MMSIINNSEIKSLLYKIDKYKNIISNNRQVGEYSLKLNIGKKCHICNQIIDGIKPILFAFNVKTDESMPYHVECGLKKHEKLLNDKIKIMLF